VEELHGQPRDRRNAPQAGIRHQIVKKKTVSLKTPRQGVLR
jgi:hypothetical protein